MKSRVVASGVHQISMLAYLNCPLEYLLPHSSQTSSSSEEDSSSVEEARRPRVAVMGPAGVFNRVLLFSREYGTCESFCMGVVPSNPAISGK